MERDANYVAVGAFMLLLIAMGIGFILWYSDAGDSREFRRYEINFNGSVGGLDQGSVVSYLGVEVGRVRRMSLDAKNPTQVKIIVEIDESAPISEATRANLNMRGITGLLFINLKQVPEGDPSKPPPMGERYPIIQSSSSDFDVLLASLPEVVGRASQLIEHVDSIFSPKNVAAVGETLENIRLTTEGLPKTAAKVATLVDEMRGTIAEVNATVAGIRSVVDTSGPDVQATLAQFRVAADNLSKATDQIGDFVKSAEAQVGHVSEHGLFELERMLRDTRAAANEFRDLSRSLKQQPSQIMYEKPNSGTEIRP
jgi:phospholipid/cholesterol/gamma-HCH transport system substrate-binding protein